MRAFFAQLQSSFSRPLQRLPRHKLCWALQRNRCVVRVPRIAFLKDICTLAQGTDNFQTASWYRRSSPLPRPACMCTYPHRGFSHAGAPSSHLERLAIPATFPTEVFWLQHPRALISVAKDAVRLFPHFRIFFCFSMPSRGKMDRWAGGVGGYSSDKP